MNITCQCTAPQQNTYKGNLYMKTADKTMTIAKILQRDVMEIVDRKTSIPHYKECVIRLRKKGKGVVNQEIYGYNSSRLWELLRDKDDCFIVSDKDIALKYAKVLQEADAKKVRK